MPRSLKVWESELDLFEKWEWNRVNKDHTSIDATRVYDKDLLVALLQTKEFRLGVVVCGSIIQANEVFSTFVGAHWNALLREACILFNVPDLKDPVRVQSVDPSTPLVTYHIDDVVVFERRPSSKVDRLKHFGSRDIILAQLVLSV